MEALESGTCNELKSDLTSAEAASVDRVVQELLGPDRKIIGVNKKVTVREHEVIMVNGTPIALEGEEGEAIKECLLRGAMPAQDLLNHLLLKAGLLVAPKRQIIQADVKVNTNVTTTENAILQCNGEVLDRRTKKTSSCNNIEGHTEEIWEPETSSDKDSHAQERRPQFMQSSCTGGLSPDLSKNGYASNTSSSGGYRLHSDRDSEGYQGRMVSPTYNYRNGQISDARIRQIKMNQRKDGLIADDEPDTARVSHSTSVKRATPCPLKRLSGLVYDEGGTVSSGTLEELIHELVPRAHASPSETFQFTFLLSSRLFITPTRLMAEVHRRADQLSYMLSSESHPTFVQNLVTMLSRWMVWFPMDFREESMQQKTRQLVQLVVELNPSVEVRLSQLLQTLNTHLAAIEKHEKQVDKLCQLSPLTSVTNLAAACPDLFDLELSSTVVAQELTRLELEFLCFLGPEELVNSFARESSRGDKNSSLGQTELDASIVEARQRASKKTNNLEAYVAWFNRLSFLVATTVCLKKKKKLRVKAIEIWIEVARECINLGNFNSLMAIITGLNMTPVSRLRRTWSKIQSAGKFAVLEHQMDPSSNFLSYRSTLRAAVSRSEGTTDKRQRIVIPFFSLLVKDLYFVNEGCASVLPNGHINFTKALQLSEKLREFARWKDVECPYQKVPLVAEFLQSHPALREEALDLESYECEPPELNEEKERHKHLKQVIKQETN